MLAESRVFAKRKCPKTHLCEIRDSSFIVDPSHVEPSSSPLPPQPTHETQDCRFPRQTNFVNSYEPLNREDEEPLLVKDRPRL